MTSLGARIKTLRKKKKLTLQGLSGDYMTKGMLSLIENDKAKPSMQSLHYIADQLDVSVNELLEQVSVTEVRELLITIETLIKDGENEEIIEKMSPLKTEQLPISYESAKVLEIYGKSLYAVGEQGWEVTLHQADHLYITLTLFKESVQVTLFEAWSKIELQQYEEALHLIREKRSVIQSKGAELETLTSLKYLTFETILLFAIGHNEEALHVLHRAIAHSRKSKTFYQVEELYRLACYYSIMTRDEGAVTFYLDKLDLYSKFVDSNETKALVLLLQAHYYNEVKGDYKEAVRSTETFKLLSGGEVDSYYAMEKGKALYHMGDIKGAWQLLNQFNIIPEWVHPFDRSLIYHVKAYQARCLMELGEWEKGKVYAKDAYEGIRGLPETPYQQFVYETFKQSQ
ncbi:MULTISPECIES: helix-turn-helix domain-containing protein [Pontibacillus]|uniref:Helix-turn-helix transcriptional regulator n=1 Tax=Pontibacillus chungwhensis TaxID=265426 RepID=A0ABY8UUZ1_9BACI|nr:MULTISPECIES: helix-turn-helix transcriptional regulator [Pontibacillus]MCD5323184.1 helix-turn-helix domain-containing protein [Pontibacillus sp. HN14]WIF96571.1 helix-turn-helix transcriptional regulator [Pontibacillus chungwhensis]